MTDPRSAILQETIRYLEQQKSQGIRHIPVSPTLLDDWPANSPSSPPSPTSAQPARTQAFRPPSTPPAKSPSSSRAKNLTPDKQKAWDELREKTLACTQCPHLVKFRKQVVFGVGNPCAELMFVGEAPGADEDEQGEPFVGKAGQLLTKMIQTMGFQRSDVYIANILKCRPDIAAATGNRKPTPEEMSTCTPWLKEQIRLITPRVMVAVGDTAVKGLLPHLKEGITRLRGKWLEYEGTPLMPTFHPSYMLHNPSPHLKRQCWEDLMQVMERLGMPISEKQQGYFLSAVNSQKS